jgi:hypothetical protein
MNEALMKAAEYIDEHGWTIGNYWDLDGRVCLVGALRRVTMDDGSQYAPAYCLLERFLCLVKNCPDILTYNDQCINDGAEASKILREAAEF